MRSVDELQGSLSIGALHCLLAGTTFGLGANPCAMYDRSLAESANNADPFFRYARLLHAGDKAEEKY